MKQKTKESHQEWIQGLEAKLASKPEKLAAFKAFIEDEEAQAYVSSSVMAEKDYYRRLNDLNTEKQGLTQKELELQQKHAIVTKDAIELKNWFDQVEPQFNQAMSEAQLARQRAAAAESELTKLGLEVPTVSTKPSGDDGVASDHPLWSEVKALKQRVQQQDLAYPQALSQLGNVVQRGLGEGFKFNMDEVIATASQRGVDLNAAYEVVTAEQRSAKLAADFEKKLEEARKEGERQALTRLSSPDQLGSTRPPVHNLFAPGDGAKDLHNQRQRLDKALEEFVKLGPENFGQF